MGETAAETLRQIDATRAAIDRDLGVLTDRLPDSDQIADKAKVVGGAAAGGAVALTTAGVMLKRRSAERARRAEAGRQAAALADYYPEAFGGVAENARSRGPLAAVLALLAGAAIGFVAFRRDDLRETAERAMSRVR